MHAYVSTLIRADQSIRMLLQLEDPWTVHGLLFLCHLRPDWKQVQEKALRRILRKKFLTRSMAQKLVDTGTEELVYTNTRCELYLGRCVCKRCQGEGVNTVGRLMMELRDHLVEHEGMRPSGSRIIRSGVFYSAAEIAGV